MYLTECCSAVPTMGTITIPRQKNKKVRFLHALITTTFKLASHSMKHEI